MPKVTSFDDALKAAGTKGCSLLLGNGFSARYFSYRSLLDKADLKPEDPVRALFDRLKTVDFERVVKALGSVDTYRIHKMMAARVTTAR